VSGLLDELLNEADEYVEDTAALRQQMAVTTYVTLALYSMGLGAVCLGNGFPRDGHFLLTLGLAALVFLAGEYATRQHRHSDPSAPTALTWRERSVFVAALAVVVASAAF